jgi:chaperonin GroES
MAKAAPAKKAVKAPAKAPAVKALAAKAPVKAAIVKPLGDRVVIEVIEESDQMTASGLFVPDTAKEKSQRGKVIAVGSGKTLDNGQKVALEVNVGDIVYFAKYGGTEVTISGSNYTILAERDILAILD